MFTAYRTPYLLHVRVAAMCLTIAVAGAGAQAPVDPDSGHVTRTVRNNARADTIEARAGELSGRKDQWLRVARMYRRAGGLRGNDPRAVESFRLSAWTYTAAGLHGPASQMMEKAAVQAAAVGDVERAAGAYIDAAFLALEDGREDRIPNLLRKARAQLGSPVLPVERRVVIEQRIKGTPRLAQLWASL